MLASTRGNALRGDCIDKHVPHNWAIDDLLVHKDLSIAGGFEIELPPFYTYDEAKQDEIFVQLANFLNTLDPGIDLQWVWKVHRDVEDVTEALDSRGLQAKLPIVRRLDEEATGKLKDRANWRTLRRFKAYVFLVLSPKYTPVEFKRNFKKIQKDRKRFGGYVEEESAGNFIMDMLSFGDPSPDSMQYTNVEWEAQCTKIGTSLSILESTLNGLEYSPVRLSSQALLDVMFEWWNPEMVVDGMKAPRLPVEPRLLTDMFITSDIEREDVKGHFRMEDKFHAILSLRTPPSDITMNTFIALLQEFSIPNLRVVNNLRQYDRSKRIKELTDKLPLIEARIGKEPALQVVSIQIRTEILKLQAGEENCWLSSVHFHTWANTEQELDRVIKEIQRIGQSCGYSVISKETFGMWNYWLAMQPGWTRDSDAYRMHTYSTSQVIGLLPMNGHPEQLVGERICNLVETSNGSVMNLNLMDVRRTSNYNTLIAGSSGTGKSFLTGSLLMGMLYEDPKITIIDMGGSYETLCEALNGEYITFDLNLKGFCVNPFQVSGSNLIPSKEDQEQMVKWVEKACCDTNEEFNKEEKGLVEQIITAMFQKKKGSIPILSDFRDICSTFGSGKDSEFAKSLANRIQPYVTTYGNLYNGKTTVNFDSDFLVFDLLKVKDNKDVGPLAVMGIINNVKQIALSEKNIQRKKFLVMDEAWVLLQDKTSCKFIVECFRTFRKYNVGIVGVSQGIGDWAIGGNPNDVLNNVTSFLILKQSNVATLRDMGAMVGLNPTEVAIVGNLKKEKGEFSEFLFMQKRETGKFSTVLVNRSSPLQYAIMTTAGIDKQAMDKIRRERGLSSMLEARLIFSREYPKGVQQ